MRIAAGPSLNAHEMHAAPPDVAGAPGSSQADPDPCDPNFLRKEEDGESWWHSALAPPTQNEHHETNLTVASKGNA